MDVFKAFGKYGNASKDVAKERLKLILIQDRTKMSSKTLSMIKGDIIRVISDYAEIDEEGIEIILDNGENSSRNQSISSLIASIPIKKVKSSGR